MESYLSKNVSALWSKSISGTIKCPDCIRVDTLQPLPWMATELNPK